MRKNIAIKYARTIIRRSKMVIGDGYIRLPIDEPKSRRKDEVVELAEIDDITCPVKALKAYLANSTHRNGALFQRYEGTRITDRYFRKKLDRVFGYLGLPKSELTPRSFRRRGVGNLCEKGADRDFIMKKGRWDF